MPMAPTTADDADLLLLHVHGFHARAGGSRSAARYFFLRACVLRPTSSSCAGRCALRVLACHLLLRFFGTAAWPATASCRGTWASRSGRRRSRRRSPDRPSRGRSGSRSRALRPSRSPWSRSMNTRPFLISDSQFGSHLWLMKRASLPPTPASITVFLSTMNRNVWLSFSSWSS